MSTVLNKKLKRDLLLSKGMLAAIIALVAVGTSFLVGMLGTYNNLTSSRDSYYSQCKMADFWIDLKKAPISDVDRIFKSVNGISEIRKRIVRPAVIDLPNVDKPITATLVSLPENKRYVINSIYLKNGSYFTPNKSNEVIVSYRFAQTRNIRPGMYITVIAKGQKKKLYVIGTAISCEYIYMVPPGSMCPNTKDYGVLWVKDSFAENTLGLKGACNNIVGMFNNSGKHNKKMSLTQFSNKLEKYGVFSSTLLHNQESNLTLSSELQSIQSMATLLPVIFLGVAALVLNVIMARLAEQERIVIGTLKALGVKNKAILWFYMKYSLFVGITGGVLGCFLGDFIASFMTQMYQQFFTFPDLHNSLYWSIMITGVLISITFAIIGTLRGVKLMIKLNPAEAMHPPPPANGKTTILERFPVIWNLFNFKTQVVIRNILRNKLRTVIGMIASALGAGLVLMSLGMQNSINYMMNFQFDNVNHTSYQLNFNNPIDKKAFYEAAAFPGVTHAEPQLALAINAYNGKINKKCVISGILPNSSMITPCDEKEMRVKVPSTGVLMTKRLADKLNLKIGDYLTFKTIRGVQKEYKVKIVNTIKSTLGIHIYASYDYFNKLLNENSILTNVLLKTQQTKQQKADFLNQLKTLPSLMSFNDTAVSKQQLSDEMDGTFSTMVYSLIFFAAIIFFGSILNAALISISERKREIATYRVLGYRPTEVGFFFLLETLIVNMSGAIIGLPIGYYMLFGTCHTFNNDMFSMPCIINFQSYITTLILSFIFIFSSYLIIQKTINKLNWPDALKSKE